MTILEKASRFFEPLKENKFITFLSVLKFSFLGLHAILSVLIIKYSIHSLEINDKTGFIWGIQMFIVAMMLFFIFTWFLRKSDWPILYHRIEWFIYKRYIPLLIHLDNNYVDSIGT